MTKKSRSSYAKYGYGVVNGNMQYGRFEPADNDDGYEFVGYGHYIAITTVSTDIDGGSPILTLAYDDLAAGIYAPSVIDITADGEVILVASQL